jgi:broad specificity phosphatase PhoE
MRLFLIRHGESESNAHWEQMVEGSQLNSRLTEKGQDQVLRLADWMANKVPEVDAIYTSSLHRTIETAAPLEAHYQLKAIIDHRIREGGYCYNSGAPIEDDLLPIKKLVNFHADPFAPFAPHPAGVESYNDLRTRVGNFIQELVEKHTKQSVIVVLHGWVLNAFLDHVFNVGSHRSVYIFAENTSVTYLEHVHPNRIGPWRAYFVAQTSHLEDLSDGLKSIQREA